MATLVNNENNTGWVRVEGPPPLISPIEDSIEDSEEIERLPLTQTVDPIQDFNSQPYYKTNKVLTETQIKLLDQIKKDRFSVLGKTVFLVQDKGRVFNTSPEALKIRAAIISKIPNNPTSQQFKMDFVAGGSGSFWLHQFDTVSTIKSTKVSLIKRILTRANEISSVEYKRQKDMLLRYKRNITYHQKASLAAQKDTAEADTLLQKIKTSNITPRFFMQQIKNIERHSKVEQIYPTKEGNLIVKTKMLYGIKEETNEVSNIEMGRFIIHISFNRYPIKLQVANLDYQVCGSCVALDALCTETGAHTFVYGHPTVEYNSICYGNHIEEIKYMLTRFELYQVIDFLIIFLATIPGPKCKTNPYIPYSVWLKYKTKQKPSDSNFIKERKISWKQLMN